MARIGIFVLPILVFGLRAAPAQAALSASGTLSAQQLGPSSYKYSMTLTNTGTTPIGTFWFSWIPFYDLLPSSPTEVSSPPGWIGTPMHEGFGVDSIQAPSFS